ncbi:D-glycero-alpha-D-manno-heptose-1,7-bisphosphate 7-phosphatase [Occallatibacter savannae]|uniref:D-glycero-alpha-D-manno-heptose-1,7-bisphosphate 7-phosphatase n=1 Tax=Occallatibacter savannae TaxID=1002691 RepID=UPI001EF6432D
MLSQSGSAGYQLKTVFLDRDGVINKKMPERQYVRTIDEFQLLPGVAEAIAQMNRAGMRVIVLSNQRGIALGLYSAAAVDAIHQHLQSELRRSQARIDAFFYCPHDKSSCNCRKPLPGLYEQARKQFPDLSPETSVMVGDSLSDIEFGSALGMRTVWIAGPEQNRKRGWETAAKAADLSFASLPQAVEELMKLSSL